LPITNIRKDYIFTIDVLIKMKRPFSQGEREDCSNALTQFLVCKVRVGIVGGSKALDMLYFA
jgi:hypothetical protein